MTRLLILGGGGILGSEIIREAESRGFDYSAPRSYELDVTNPQSLKDYILNFKPTWIVNCAAWTNVDGAEKNPEQAHALNADAIQNLASAVEGAECAVIHVSTDYVFDGNSEVPYEVTDQTSPINQYGASKLHGEEILLKSSLLNAYVVRTSWLYGTNGKNFVKTIAKKALQGESANVVDDQFGSPTSARDLARGIYTLINVKPAPGIYHFANKGKCTWFRFAQEIYKLSEANLSLVEPISSESLQLVAKRPKNSELSTRKWRELNLGEIKSWEDSLADVFPEIIAKVNEEMQS